MLVPCSAARANVDHADPVARPFEFVENLGEFPTPHRSSKA